MSRETYKRWTKREQNELLEWALRREEARREFLREFGMKVKAEEYGVTPRCISATASRLKHR